VPADWITYLRRYRPAMTREEVAVAASISIATLTRRLREGLDADEVIRAARAVGASPAEALLELGLLDATDVRRVAVVDALDTVPERVLLEELLERAREREDTDAADREEAGLPPAAPARFAPVVDVAFGTRDVLDVELSAADDAADYEGEDDANARHP